MANVSISGCKIQINGDKIIKYSSSKEYNQRLLKQIEKQYLFSKNFNLNSIKTPHIFEISTKKLFSFSMEKINGADWLEYFTHTGPFLIEEFLQNLIVYLNFLKSISQESNPNAQILLKLESLKLNSKFKVLIDRLINNLNQSNSQIPSSFCHGDLTLSNMLFLKNDFYFIDFLDSFVDSYWIDLIKLRQDLKYKFCLKYSGIQTTRLINTFNKLNELIEKEFKEEISHPIFKILETINYLRIEPYISAEKSIIVRDILNEEESYYTNLR